MKTNALLWGLLGVVACGPPAKKDTIKLGAVLSQTGDLAGIGAEQLDAANLAIEEINKAGGVLGTTFEMIARDDGTDEVKGKNAAQALVDAKVVAAVGAVGSAITLEAAGVTSAAKIPLVSGSATSPILTTMADQGYFFRTCASDALQGKLLAKRAKARNFTRMAVVYIPGAYGKGLADAFESTFVAGGGTVTLKHEYTEGLTSYTSLMQTMFGGTTKPQAVLLVAYPVDGAQMVKDYLSGFAANQAFFYFTDALADTAFITAAGASTFTFAHEGTGPGTPVGARFDTFKNAFKAKYGKDPSFGSFAVNVYDAIYLIALSIEGAGKAEGMAIRDQLVAVSAGGTAYGPSDFKQAVADVKAAKDINFEGASGDVNMDASGDVVAPYDIWKVQSSAITVIESNVSL